MGWLAISFRSKVMFVKGEQSHQPANIARRMRREISIALML